MAARSNVLHRRDFLRSLGAAAGIGVAEIPARPAAAAPTLTPAAPGVTAAPTAPAPPPAAQPPTDADAAPPAAAAPETAEAAAVVTPIVVSPTDRHLLSRFSYGISQELAADTQARGASAWFEDQLDPDSIPDTFADGLTQWWPHLLWSPQKMWDEDQNDNLESWVQQANFQRWTLMRRIYSKRQVHETMAEFWSNLLYIPAPMNKCFPHRVGFDDVIREHALGRFDDMLEAAILHPGMLCYLDAAKSTVKAVNENLGRELLELHTVGRDPAFEQFTEDHVADSARILTGWHVDTFKTWDASYVATDHATGFVRVLDFESVNANFNGQQVARDYLQYLAHHEATAARVARKLAVRFVSDMPSQALVDHLAQVFTDSGTDIKTTLRALVAHPEFLSSTSNKVRTPTEDTVNTFRVLDVEILPPTGADGEASTTILFVCAGMGQAPFEWPRPDGFPDAADAWSSASRALGSWRAHKNASQGSFPKIGAVYHPQSFWLPTLPIRFDEMVDQLSQRLLAQPANAQLQRTATKAVDVLSDEYVLATSQLVKYRIPALLVALLDTPQHMMR